VVIAGGVYIADSTASNTADWDWGWPDADVTWEATTVTFREPELQDDEPEEPAVERPCRVRYKHPRKEKGRVRPMLPNRELWRERCAH